MFCPYEWKIPIGAERCLAYCRGRINSYPALGFGPTCMPVTLENLSVVYDRDPVICRLDGAFADGTLTAITGPNGAGKSTLLKALAGLVDYEGAIDLGNVTQSEIAYLPQIHESDKTFSISVFDLVSMGYWHKAGPFKKFTAAMLLDVEKAIEKTGLKGFADSAINTLSAGQFQRALFARAMLQDAKLILLDEPFSAVDVSTTKDLLNILEGWSATGKTVIAVLHEMDQIHEIFPETLLLARECVAWGKTAEVLTNENLARTRNIMAMEIVT